MNSVRKNLACALAFSLLAAFGINSATAGGEVGDHVNHLTDNLNKYSEEVVWLVSKTDDIVNRYQKGGAKEANSKSLIDNWEAVNFHAAIESNYIPLYATIWQGLYGVKDGIDKNLPIEQVRAEQQKLETALWQSLGAVKLAAQFQDKGLLKEVALRDGAPTNSIEALDQIKTRLDRVTAKYAEKLVKESVDIVHDTYLNLFEGVEGELIAHDAELVEDLEKDFNVTLPKALQGKASLDDVRKIVSSMGAKLDKAKSLLVKEKANKKKVF